VVNEDMTDTTTSFQAAGGGGGEFETVDLGEPRGVDLAALHERVVRQTSRIELRSRAGASVLISKSELQGLERTIEILSESETVRSLHEQLQRIAASV
jgi:hypothetical protein